MGGLFFLDCDWMELAREHEAHGSGEGLAAAQPAKTTAEVWALAAFDVQIEC